MSRKGKIGSKEYTANGFYWAVIYINHVTAIYPRQRDAVIQVRQNNREWKQRGWPEQWRVLRFRYRFKGTEIDAYLHSWERNEIAA